MGFMVSPKDWLPAFRLNSLDLSSSFVHSVTDAVFGGIRSRMTA